MGYQRRVHGNPAEQQPDEDLFRGSISKKVWQRKESSALSSSLPLWLLQHPCLGASLIASRFVNASTPSLGLAMHTGETQTTSVGLAGLASATFLATLTVATSNPLLAHQGASLVQPVRSTGDPSGVALCPTNLYIRF